MAIRGGPDISEQGLVLYLDAGNTRSYPGSGTIWFDLSSNKYNATLTNPLFDNSAIGNFVMSSTRYATVSLPTTIVLNTGFAYCVWARATTLSSYQTLIDWPNDSMFFGTNSTSLITYNPIINTGFTLSTNLWYHLCISRMSGNAPIIFYVNGSPVFTSANNSGAPGTTTISIGHGNGGETWVGNIAVVQIYRNISITSDVILQNFNAQRSRFGL